METVRGTFSRQALPMTWDFAEANVFGPSSGSVEKLLDWISKVLEHVITGVEGHAIQQDACAPGGVSSERAAISTDPPYYDNVGYADLSDLFYIWLRRSIGPRYPSLFATVGAQRPRAPLSRMASSAPSGCWPRRCGLTCP
jgi:putative DNA methylase